MVVWFSLIIEKKMIVHARHSEVKVIEETTSYNSKYIILGEKKDYSVLWG